MRILFVLFFLFKRSSQCIATVEPEITTTRPITTTSTSTTTTTTTTTRPPRYDDNTWTLSTAAMPICYKVFPVANPAASTWYAASDFCISINSKIAPIRNVEERLAFRIAADKLDLTGCPDPNHLYTGVYFGLKDVSVLHTDPADYRNIYDSSVAVFTNWYPSEPVRTGTLTMFEQCGAAMINSNYQWNDIDCGNRPVINQMHCGVVCAKEPII